MSVERCVFALFVFLFSVVLFGQSPARDRSGRPLPTTSSVSGRVVDARTGEPVRNAVVRLGVGDDALGPTLTNTEGAFTFTDVAPGSHLLSAWKTGYARATLGAPAGLGPATLVEVRPGDSADGLAIPLVRGGAISGRVLDDLGDPLVGATIAVDRVTRVNGRDTTVRVDSSGTNDLGEYRIGGLPPGRFVIALVGAPRLLPQVFETDAPNDWAKIYYPGVAGLAQAQPVVVQPGEESAGIDFAATLARQPAVTVSVVGVDGSGTDATLTFGSDSALLLMMTFMETSRRYPAPRVRLEPGEWIAYARNATSVGMTRLSVGGDDVSASIQLGPGGRLRGRLVSVGSPLPSAASVIVSAVATDRALERAPSATATSRVDVGGLFELKALLGERELRIGGLPHGFGVQAILAADGHDLSDEPIAFSDGVNLDGVRVIVTDRLAHLSGTVLGSRRESLSDYSLLVFPDDPGRLRNPRRWAQWIRPNQAGRFTVDLLAGDYLAAVVTRDEVDAAQWANAAYLEQFRSRAARVAVHEGEHRSVTLSWPENR